MEVALLERAAFEDELMFELPTVDELACCAALDVLALFAAFMLAELLPEALLDASAALRAFPVVEEALLFAASLADWFAALEEFWADAELAASAAFRALPVFDEAALFADSLALSFKVVVRLDEDAELAAEAPLVASPELAPDAVAAGVDPAFPLFAK